MSIQAIIDIHIQLQTCTWSYYSLFLHYCYDARSIRAIFWRPLSLIANTPADLILFFQLLIAQPCAVKLVKSWSEMSWGAARQVHKYIEALDAAAKGQHHEAYWRISLQQQLEFRGAMWQAGLCTEKLSLTKTWVWLEIDLPENLSGTSREHLQRPQRFRMCSN